MKLLKLCPALLLGVMAALLLVRTALPAVAEMPPDIPEPVFPAAAGFSDGLESGGVLRLSAECAARDLNGDAPCSEEEYQAEAAAWNEYYGCDPRGCGFIDFDALPESGRYQGEAR
ncbi:MAG: hypothetical protein Q4D82_04645 [Neisseria sp.]|nr:hypothetical protein [Neisseria sp.]